MNIARVIQTAALLAALALSASFRVHAESPFVFAATPGQLPKTVVPQSYTLTITPNLQTLTFRGRETVEIKILVPTREIVMNQRELNVSEASLMQGAAHETPAIKTDNGAQTLTLSFPHTLLPGTYRLTLAYRGKIGALAQGGFSIKYQTAHGAKRLFATMMEPSDARRLFPGWDEPVFRAAYQMNAIVPQKFIAVSNMPEAGEASLPGGLKRVSFQQTPSMASYLVVLVAGDLEVVSGESQGIKLRVLTVEGKRAQGRYALGVMKQILPYYNSYFGVKYPLPKLDLIALPGGFDGAMENWGGIVFNENTLLFDPKTSSEETRRNIYNTVSHETAHQWFGDLVTMAWWDNLWLNEGFASWMAYKASDHFNPKWYVWEDAAADKSSVMEIDASRTTHPIQQSVRDPAQAAAAFDDITYDKGAAVIHMFEASLGEAPFRAGIRRYMAAHAYSSTTTDDLWASLEASSSQPMRRIAPGWTRLPGFPVISATEGPSGGGVILSQEKFSTDDPHPAPAVWQVPVVWRTLSAAGQSPLHTILLGYAPVRLSVPPGTVVELNAGNTGYYRVQYAPALFGPLAARMETLPPADRVGLIGDTWAMTQAGRVPIPEYLNLVQSAHSDTNLAVTEQIGSSLDTLDFLERGQPGQADWEAWERSLLHAQFAPVGWDARPGEPSSAALRRANLIATLGSLHDPAVVAEARARFASYLKNPDALAPSLRGAVFGIVGRYADQATYDQLHALGRATASTEGKDRFYHALSGALDPALAQQTLDIALTDELDAGMTPGLLKGVASEGEQPALAWQFFQHHAALLTAKQDPLTRATFVPGLFHSFTDASRAAELESYAKLSLPADDAAKVAEAAARIRFHAALKQRLLPEVDRWITTHSKA